MARIRLIKRVLYVVPVIGAMAFGTAQAFASTSAPREELACSKGCFLECGPAGGICSSQGVCVCR